MKTKNNLCIAEWQSFGIDEINTICKDKARAEKIFKELIEFAKYEDNQSFLRLIRNNGTDKLKAQNFVGLIQTKSGFCVEILPKTFRTEKEGQGFSGAYEKNKDEAKEILLKMLKSLKNSPFKQTQISTLRAQKFPLLEIFILMFLEELEKLIKKGMRSDYISKEENRKFLKGKLLFNENLKHNFAHKERFYTASDEFSQNIAPNRIIKSTLELLSKQNLSPKTSSRLNFARFVFAQISPSKNIEQDLSKGLQSRLFKPYEMLLLWCELFLKQKSFTPYQGHSKAFALLFDMNKLFESFVAQRIKKWLSSEGFRAKNPHYQTSMQYMGLEQKELQIKTQEKTKFLAQESNQNVFQLRPDIIAYDKNNTFFIADSKWKILNAQDKHYKISQSDMYQIFAYLAKYQCKKGFLIYPQIQQDEATDTKEFVFKASMLHTSSSQMSLYMLFFPLCES
ncbi:McrC family protein [Helicobacter marmotae]|uniref:Restriction endonuclease n=1 Tax=Helicobacter marmotae TaxID=152490 RepID=A0A3D8I4J0_9HELI|nr:McrC family protein [Helicobacter marmotae]RDU60049.1 restriction endonuclease [Helicobacter marmotae]